VEIRPVDINRSGVECALESMPTPAGRPALRLGLCMVKGMSRTAAEQVVTLRGESPYKSIGELAARARLRANDYAALAAADALRTIAGNRHKARWDIAGVAEPTALFPAMEFAEALPLLPAPTRMEDVVSDYAHTGLTLRTHPMAVARTALPDNCVSAAELWQLADKTKVYVAGLVITRQRPGSAANVTFVTLEDEAGFINLVVWEKVAEQYRRVLLNASVLGVWGETQKQDGVLHVIVRLMADLSHLLHDLSLPTRSFH
jgi:error-prone DNA polymerase